MVSNMICIYALVNALSYSAHLKHYLKITSLAAIEDNKGVDSMIFEFTTYEENIIMLPPLHFPLPDKTIKIHVLVDQKSRN